MFGYLPQALTGRLRSDWFNSAKTSGLHSASEMSIWIVKEHGNRRQGEHTDSFRTHFYQEIDQPRMWVWGFDLIWVFVGLRQYLPFTEVALYELLFSMCERKELSQSQNIWMTFPAAMVCGCCCRWFVAERRWRGRLGNPSLWRRWRWHLPNMGKSASR